MISPYKGSFRVTSIQGQRWGVPHRGLDMVGIDKQIYAVSDGTVVISSIITDKSNPSWAFGNRVWIKDKNNKIVCYNHLSQRRVSVGQAIKQGDLIGVEGATGHCVPVGASHLHIELRSNLGVPFQELKIYEYLDIPNQVKIHIAPVPPVKVETIDDVLLAISNKAKFDNPTAAISAMKTLQHRFPKDFWDKILRAMK